MKNVYKDTKLTIWHRTYFEFEDNISNEVIINSIQNEGAEHYDSEYLLDTTEDLPVDENMGFATEEIYNDNNEIIFANGKH